MRTIRVGDRGEWFGSNGEYRNFIYDDMMQCGIDAVREVLSAQSLLVNFCDFVDYNSIAIRVQSCASSKDFDGRPIRLNDGYFDFVLSKSISCKVTTGQCVKLLGALKAAYSETFVPSLEVVE